MINAIVITVTILAIGFVLVWLFVPGFKRRVERPKHLMLKNEERFRERSGNPKD